jgi:hypothetical protein
VGAMGLAREGGAPLTSELPYSRAEIALTNSSAKPGARGFSPPRSDQGDRPGTARVRRNTIAEATHGDLDHPRALRAGSIERREIQVQRSGGHAYL